MENDDRQFGEWRTVDTVGESVNLDVSASTISRYIKWMAVTEGLG